MCVQNSKCDDKIMYELKLREKKVNMMMGKLDKNTTKEIFIAKCENVFIKTETRRRWS